MNQSRETLVSKARGMLKGKLFGRTEEKLPFPEGIHHERAGFVSEFGSYQLVSLDRGRSWYSTQKHEDGRVEVTGIADPVLLKELAEMDARSELHDYLIARGRPLDLNDPEHVKMLTRVPGFAITRKNR